MNDINFDVKIKKIKEKIFTANAASNILLFMDEDIFYLTGFYAKNSNSAFLITDKKKFLFVNFIYLEEAKNSGCAGSTEIILYKGDKNKYIAGVLKGHNIKDVLIQSNYISHSEYLKLEDQLNKIKIKAISVENPLVALRLIKDEK